MAFNDIADEGRLAKAVGARQVELAAAIDGAIAVVIGFALEFPLIRHSSDPLPRCYEPDTPCDFAVRPYRASRRMDQDYA